MRVCVFGLGHLGTVTAACLAADGHDVVGLDPDAGVVADLATGDPPVLEPGLPELLARHAPEFTTDVARALEGTEIVWLADDTPVDEADEADTAWVLERASAVLGAAPPDTLVVVSSQLPVGTVARLEHDHPRLRFACIPENLRLGRAIEAFRAPDRVVVGVRAERDRDELGRLLSPHADRIVWMSVESAELTKHALNAFLATAIAFTNEIAGICEAAGADAREVELGLRSDRRVGPHAYVSPGAAFAGGTLARDVGYLRHLGHAFGRPTELLDGVTRSNEAHRAWARHRLEEEDVSVAAVWGLAYKPGTDSVRRSDAVELCRWLAERGAEVRVHDPAVRALPPTLAGRVAYCSEPLDAVRGADALVVAVGWQEYANVPAASVLEAMQRPLVLDPAGLLADTVGRTPPVRYLTVGAGR